MSFGAKRRGLLELVPAVGLRDLSRIEPWQRLPCLRARLGATSRLSDGGDKSHAVHGALRYITERSHPMQVFLWNLRKALIVN